MEVEMSFRPLPLLILLMYVRRSGRRVGSLSLL